MKPVSSVFALLILFQTLVFGTLVKINLPLNCTDTWEESGIQKQVVLDPFLMQGKEGFQQNVQDKNKWIPYHYNKTFTIRNTASLPLDSELLFKQEIRHYSKTIPVFILNGTLRL